MIIMHKTGICPLSYNLTKNWLNKFKFLNIYLRNSIPLLWV